MTFQQAMIAVLNKKCVRLPIWAPKTYVYFGPAPLGFTEYAKNGVMWFQTTRDYSQVWLPAETEIHAREWIECDDEGLARDSDDD